MKRPIDLYSIRKFIYMNFEEYEDLIPNITNGLKKAEYDMGELSIDDSELAKKSSVYWAEDINKTLSNYFGVHVVSVNADNDEYPVGIWIEFVDVK